MRFMRWMNWIRRTAGCLIFRGQGSLMRFKSWIKPIAVCLMFAGAARGAGPGNAGIKPPGSASPTAAAPAAAPAGKLSAGEIHRLYDQGNYAEVLKQTRAILSQKDQSAYDLYDLLSLRGEALLRTKAVAPAADAFRDASKSAKSPEQASLARATAFLLSRCRNEIYISKTRSGNSVSNNPPSGNSQASNSAAGNSPPTTAPSFSVLDADSRKQAFGAVLTDELASKAKELEAAKKASTLDPVLSLAPSLSTFQDLDRAANGNTEKTDAVTTPIAGHARELMQSASSDMLHQVEHLEKLAGSKDAYVPGSGTGFRITRGKRGLTSTETQELRSIAQTCKTIVNTCDQLGKTLGPAGGDFATTAKAATDVGVHAETAATKYAPKTRAGASTRKS